MPSRQVRKQMQSIAVQRVLGRSFDRAAIGSIADLRKACQDELDADYGAISAEAESLVARLRQTFAGVHANILARHLRCAACDGPIQDPKRLSRRYCSDRCRQRGHRARAV